MNWLAEVDWSTISLLALWVAALVAAIRAKVPAIDGPWVLALGAGVAAVISVLVYAPDWLAVARYGGLLVVGAVGGVELLRHEGERFLEILSRSRE